MIFAKVLEDKLLQGLSDFSSKPKRNHESVAYISEIVELVGVGLKSKLRFSLQISFCIDSANQSEVLFFIFF